MGFMWKLFWLIVGAGIAYLAIEKWPKDSRTGHEVQTTSPQTPLPEHFKRWMIDNAGGYEEITYQARGRSWFVLSGYRGDQIYYEKVMFSCGGRVVNILAIAYPTSERGQFDPVVERMEDTFKPSQECAHASMR